MTTDAELDARVENDNLTKRFVSTVARLPDQTAVRHRTDDGVWHDQSFAQLADLTARLTSALADLGVGPGDRVALMLGNRPEFHALDLAVLFRGATPVSIYNSSAPDQIQHMMTNCRARVAVVANQDLVDRFAVVREQLVDLEHIVVIDDSDGTTLSYDDLATAASTDLGEAVGLAAPDDLATIIYTSGTTGPPKGVMLTHRNICWTLESVVESMRVQADIGDMTGLRHLSYLPMAHIMERLLGHYDLVAFGLEVSCCPDTALIGEFLREVRPNIFIGVPRVWEKLHSGGLAVLAADPEKSASFSEAVAAAAPLRHRVAMGEATDTDLETLEFLESVAFAPARELIGLDRALICLSGAAPLSPDVLRWFRAVGIPLSEGYGLSETTGVLSWSHAARPGTVGEASIGVTMTIADDGEILAQGGNIFEGYLDAPDQTAEVIDDDGWFHTGDIGTIDDDGVLSIVDRKKELIITAGGKNVSPANLEVALKQISLVGQACVVGEKRPFIAALVVLDPDAAAAWAAAHHLTGHDATLTSLATNPDVIAEIDAGLRGVMADFNRAESVKRVAVLGEEWLPDTDLLTPTAKLKRRGIHTRFAHEIEALYAPRA